MNMQTWSAEQEAQLRERAQAHGVLPEQLASLSALSPDQIAELLHGRPDGLPSRFYSPQIKRHAGEKLLARLDGDVTATLAKKT